MLESYVKKPGRGLCELVWNAFDEDATHANIVIEANTLGGIERVTVADDGNGMTVERATSAFATVGDSWKRMPGTLSPGNRPVHGSHGRGRYTAFGLGRSIRWSSTARAVDGGLAGILITSVHADLQQVEIQSVEPADQPGTTVTVSLLSDEAVEAFDTPDVLRNQLLTEFALHLDRFPEFQIRFLGDALDANVVIDARTEIPLELPEDTYGNALLTIIEWKLDNVERRLYLCSEEGSIVDELQPRVQAPGAEFTAYLTWDGFHSNNHLILEDDTETPAGKVIDAARTALRLHLAASSRKREAEAVQRWQEEGVYPFSGEPQDSVEGATRSVFNVVAMAASRTLDETKSRYLKAMALDLLKSTLESNPESLIPIMRKVAQLPAARIEELKQILDRSSITQLIQVGKEIGSRVEFLNGLDSILFDRGTKQRLLERRQLHRILVHETWLFGEEWTLTGDDEPLDAVLRKFLTRLDGAELANTQLTDRIVREDGRRAIPDLVLGRSLETREDHSRQLVVELKRPSHTLTPLDVDQLRSYASAITNDERFARTNVTWDFWLVGNETSREVDEMRAQTHLAHGIVQSSTNYQLMVRTWAEVLDDARHRLKFVQRSLQYESSKDTGLAHLREKYAEYLPPEDATLPGA